MNIKTIRKFFVGVVITFFCVCSLSWGCTSRSQSAPSQSGPSQSAPSSPAVLASQNPIALNSGQQDPQLFATKQRGVSWVARPQRVNRDDFATLVENHVNWIVQTPFGWQETYDSPQLNLKTSQGWWGETDEGLRTTTQIASSLGIQTLLKPHIWLLKTDDGKWRTDIDMKSEEDWQTWFNNYRTFILHYARFAEENGIPALCIGTELQNTAVKREQDWRQLIVEIRQVYSGKLTYAANWHQAFEDIQFWDDLDFIGIQAYFPLAGRNNPSLEELKQGWRSHLSSIEKVQARYNKEIVFTELGYRSTEDAAIAPWEWPEDSELQPKNLATQPGLDTQAKCYEAFFQTVWTQDWFAGMYLWKWFPELHRGQGAIGQGFTPQNKPAEQVIRRWYQQSKEEAV